MGITFFVEGQPVAKARPRVTRRGAYTPDKTKGWQERVEVAAYSAMMTRRALTAPRGTAVAIDLLFYFRMPKSWTKAKREQMAGQRHIQRPDLDNLVKAVTDALNGICYWDDEQVAHVKAGKKWAVPSGIPGVSVFLRSIE